MASNRICIVFLASLAMAAIPSRITGVAAAQSLETAGSAMLVPPPGWTRGSHGKVVSFAPPGEERSVVLYVLPGEEPGVPLDPWFATRWQSLLSRYRPVFADRLRASLTPQGDVRAIAAGLEDAAGGRVFVAFFVVASGRRVQPLLFVARRLDGGLERYAPVLDAVLASVRLLPPTEQPPPRVVELADAVELAAPATVAAAEPPAPIAAQKPAAADQQRPEPRASGALDGLYVGLALGPQLMTQSSREDYRIFFPDGTWLWRLPQEGLEGFDAARSRREFPAFWGTYRVTGNQVILRLDQGSSETVAQRDRNGGLNIPGGAALFPVANLTGQRLEGTYAREAGAFPPIAFRADGTFDDRGALNAVGLSGPDMMFSSCRPAAATTGSPKTRSRSRMPTDACCGWRSSFRTGVLRARRRA